VATEFVLRTTLLEQFNLVREKESERREREEGTERERKEEEGR
jgi:hypothetical protein